MIVINVLIDADGCPVTDIAIRLCREFHIPCLLLCDTSHEFHRDGAETLVFDKGADSVDYALVNRVRKGDLVITQENIDALLFVRHESRKHRAAGNRMKGPKKRTAQQDSAFEQALRTILQTSVQG